MLILLLKLTYFLSPCLSSSLTYLSPYFSSFPVILLISYLLLFLVISCFPYHSSKFDYIWILPPIFLAFLLVLMLITYNHLSHFLSCFSLLSSSESPHFLFLSYLTSCVWRSLVCITPPRFNQYQFESLCATSKKESIGLRFLASANRIFMIQFLLWDWQIGISWSFFFSATANNR